MMQPVSYMLYVTAHTHSSCITLAAQEEPAQLASPLAYFFSCIFLPSLPFPLSYIVHFTELCVTRPRTCACTHA